MLEKRVQGKRTSPPPGRRRAVHLIAAAAMLVIAGCALVQRPTPAPPTSTTEPASPTATSVPTTQPPTSSPTPPPATVTLAPTSPPSTPTPPPPTATASPPPPTPTSSPTPTRAPEVVIHAFRADVDVADPGDTITLIWDWSGGESAIIYHMLPTGQLSEPYWEVGPKGSLRYTISPQRRNYDTFALFVHDEDGVAAQDTLQVELRCPDVWFFSPAPDICPAGPPLITDGAEQHFERGTMLWVKAEDRIYVLFDDAQGPQWTAFTDEWDEGEPPMDPGIEPPPGLQQPVRGFGLVWREQPHVRERVGWALDQERGYETALQRTSHFKYPVLYIRALDGGVWELGPNGGTWQRLPPSP